ncbi:hypothetical protein JXR01_02585 [Candidatus Kaiserbacteria bacterium]|nr:MAG: hypothetical protein JXR01_02585 [Candidatus Kaiserbacteria bacterium]
MVHISKNKVASPVQEKLFKELADLFVANTSATGFSKLLFELLSKTERIMLAKRVGIIGALLNEYSAYEISQLFKVSTSTVIRIETQMQQGKFDYITSIFKKKKARASFLHILETMVTLGFPGVANKRVRAKVQRDMHAWKAGG